MKTRIDMQKIPPGIFKVMFGLGKYVDECGLAPALLNLVKLRASQLNGCAYCIDMHSKDLRAAGESEQRVYELDAWRDTPFYDDREQAALAWTEAVTILSDGHVSDEVYEQARSQFSEKELADLTLAVVAINGWNRLNIAFRTTPGSYTPGQFKKMQDALAA